MKKNKYTFKDWFVCFGTCLIIWQSFTYIILTLTGKNEYAAIFAIGAFAILIVSLMLVITKSIYNVYANRTYEAFTLHRTFSLPLEHVRIKKKDIRKYYNWEGEGGGYIKPCDWKPSSCVNINRIKKNGWFCQSWVDENVRKQK